MNKKLRDDVYIDTILNKKEAGNYAAKERSSSYDIVLIKKRVY